MSSHNTESSDTKTLEYLLSVIVENREQRCAEVREQARLHNNEILKQAHTRVRERVHHHVIMLREKYQERISAAQARNQTLIRQQHQLADKEFLETAWPLLREALMALWREPASRARWIDTAIADAASIFLQQNWCIEHPLSLNDEEKKHLKYDCTDIDISTPELAVSEDIEAGIRIIAGATVFDATLEGLLQQRTAIEAILISRINQETPGHD
jgi:hypothetical protein